MTEGHAWMPQRIAEAVIIGAIAAVASGLIAIAVLGTRLDSIDVRSAASADLLANIERKQIENTAQLAKIQEVAAMRSKAANRRADELTESVKLLEQRVRNMEGNLSSLIRSAPFGGTAE